MYHPLKKNLFSFSSWPTGIWGKKLCTPGGIWKHVVPLYVHHKHAVVTPADTGVLTRAHLSNHLSLLKLHHYSLPTVLDMAQKQTWI